MDMVVKTKRKANRQNEIVNDGDKVWVTISRNVNLGNYESYKLDAGFSRTIKTDENPMDLIIEMEAELAPFVNKKARIIKKRKERGNVK